MFFPSYLSQKMFGYECFANFVLLLLLFACCCCLMLDACCLLLLSE